MLLLGISISSHATHLRAGEITVERVSCNSLTFRITVTVFTNTINTSVLFGGEDDWLDFGDGSQPRLIPETPNTLRPDLGEGIATASYTIEYTYAGYGEYIISYSEPNRNEGVVNMDISVNTRFYIETKIVVDPFFGCNNTPKLLVPPIDRACTGATWFHNPGAYDPDGDSISYELVVPFRAEDQTVINYKDPSDPKFYTNYDVGNEAATGKPTFSINPADGTLTWDAPGMAGEYNIAFIVKEWRQIDGEWVSNGFVRRDMQIIVDDCDNERPDLIVPEDVCVEAGTVLDETIFGIDPDNDPVKIEAFSEIFQFPLAKSPATWKPNDGVFRPSAPPYELKFQWQTTCEHVKEQPYQVVFKITDNSKEGVNLVTFKTWNIRVVGPPPQWASATVNLQTRVSTVKWDPYFCQNAETMQVWRRVDSFAFEPDSCQTGMPEFLGFEMIASVPVKTANQFIDNNNGVGLAPGAQYCYRLVAIYPKPKGGESYVSKEICLDPILADEPVITNVSVELTAKENGRILVRWAPPFEIDKIQFPEPYQYEVQRAEVTQNPTWTTAHPGLQSDTIFFDQELNLNTRDKAYNYRIILWARDKDNPVPGRIDTSATASTVRLDASSELKKIELSWSAAVPWSNIIQTTPNKHLLFRGPGGSTEAQLQLIAEIDPTTGGLKYIDEGQHNNVPLSDAQEYCYRVMTRGAYGNPYLKEPLENYSQIVCAQPNDSIPPCKPILSVQLTNCQEFLETEPCDVSSFKNILSWVRPTEDDCAEDIQGYKIYRSSSIDGVYVWLETAGEDGDGIVRDTTFTDEGENKIGLPSLAFCYKISAVDRSGNESELSDPACNDNCPYYELPNVFSPNDGNDCNDRFAAWRAPSNYYEIDEGTGNVQWNCGEVDLKKCARFVEAVVFRVYNRWGKEVYSYESGSERSIYIDWDGRDNEGRELASGIYYYAADVTFDSVDPKKANQTIKGWVHLLR